MTRNFLVISVAMRLFGFIFFGLGLLFLAIGLGLFYSLDWSEDPENLIAPGVFAAIGLIFALIGGAVLISIRNQRIKRETLMRTGRRISCRVSEVLINRNVQVNNRHPVKVECKGELSGAVTFLSHNIYGRLKLNAGDPIDVYVDFRDDGNYWVEIPPDAVYG